MPRVTMYSRGQNVGSLDFCVFCWPPIPEFIWEFGFDEFPLLIDFDHPHDHRDYARGGTPYFCQKCGNELTRDDA